MLRGYFMPDVPDAIRDEFVVRGAVQMQHNSRLLFFALFLTTPTGADGRRPYDGPAEVSYNEGWESVTRIPLN